MIVLIIFNLRIWGKAHFFLSNGSWAVEERASRNELLWTKNIPLFEGSAEIWSKDKWAAKGEAWFMKQEETKSASGWGTRHIAVSQGGIFEITWSLEKQCDAKRAWDRPGFELWLQLVMWLQTSLDLSFFIYQVGFTGSCEDFVK